MNTRIHTTRIGEIIVQRQNVDVNGPQSWRKCAGPFRDEKTARQGELRYLKKKALSDPRRISQQLISKNWGEIKINP